MKRLLKSCRREKGVDAGYRFSFRAGCGPGAGDSAHFGALLVSAMSIPTMALVLGMLSGSGQLFEVIYMFLWYIGPVNRISAFDFMGATGQTVSAGASAAVLVITLTVLPVILLLRRHRLGL